MPEICMCRSLPKPGLIRWSRPSLDAAGYRCDPIPAIIAALHRCAVAAYACQCLRAWRELAAAAWARRRQAAQRLRGALQPQRRWPAETVMLALTMWSRYTKYMVCSRAGRAGPTYGHRAAVPRWEEWESRQLQRDARRSMAATRYTAAA